ncbi:Phosphatidylinositol 3,4,5-trisphosphate-dependent Rac exchanger 2 protein [Exophiala dermatitidis]|nr:Phosphatidylinositol 3,4,5-trisphosphate-dependent Rac exchanger 2 protein [Exophiala dermatitidis]KAJ4519511.1 Phosphatidylinositol 3,4,5-trisphosphate-dependent Rac exchanger 2 protein [Exophiala dermatitidis]KAJ4529328.1 Phosphatidylinositol 3,4,5-trisphosphate-dependent Rac exchanger 2 protein [Exophiala dermatitidis]KAJ4544017.1 Phosphatidylinositol 3,4,5-trisphosphate-dependent Rac exchanger 2 protein [Exophiala dermatitidis]KAJ4549191.1 Phosphatidylinositol 3,4,5-trisphosphate-depende
MSLTRSTDPLVWIDCEMTGLDPQTDTIMSIACILTTSDLQPLDSQGFEAVIQHTPAQLSKMSEWCVRTHGANGLTQQCLSSTTTAKVAAEALLAYIKHYIPEPGRALLAGNSIHADKAFLTVPPWNIVLEHLHYRLFDVSAMKEMVRRWARPEVLEGAPKKQLKHSAREDILESIEEARYYKKLIEGMMLAAPTTSPAAAAAAAINNTAAGRRIAQEGVPPLQAATTATLPSTGTGGGGQDHVHHAVPQQQQQQQHLQTRPPQYNPPNPNQQQQQQSQPQPQIQQQQQPPHLQSQTKSPLQAKNSATAVGFGPTNQAQGRTHGQGQGKDQRQTDGPGNQYVDYPTNTNNPNNDNSNNHIRHPGPGPAPALNTKQGQEALQMMSNNGNRAGDVGTLDAGFRTDVP